MLHVIFSEGLQDDAYIAEHTEGVDDGARDRPPLHARGGRRGHGRAGRGHPRHGARVRGRATRRDLLHARHHRARLRRRQHLVALEPGARDRPPRLRVDRAERAARPEQRPGPERLRRQPGYFPGYQPLDDPEVRAKFAAAWGVDVPETPGYRLDQIISGLHDGRTKALYLVGENPAHTEPNAKHVEEGFEHVEFVVAQDLFLNELGRSTRDVVFPASSFAEKDGTFTNTERRVNRVGPACPAPARRGSTATSSSRWRGRWARRGPSTPTRSRSGTSSPTLPELVRHPLRPARGAGHPVAVPRPRRPRLEDPARAAPARPDGRASSGRSSTSRRSSFPTPSTR